MPKVLTNLDLNGNKIVGLNFPLADTDMANKLYADKRMTPMQTVKGTTTQTNTSATVMTAITGLTFSLFPGVLYHFKFMGTWQTNNTAGGFVMGFTTPPATTYCSWNTHIASATAAAGTDYWHQNSANALGTIIGNTGAPNTATNYAWEVEGFVQASGLGNLTLGFGTSSAGRTATNNAGCMGMLTFVG